MKILGIETSCDETAAAVVEINEQTRVCRMLSNTVVSQIDIHKAYGGVVPEIAARSHIEAIIPVIDEALKTADLTKEDIDAVAVTYGAGLGGSLLIGVMTARSMAIALKKPLYAINHVEAHVYANFITEVGPQLQTTNYQLPTSPPSFPLLALIVSGGHTQLVLFKDHFDYQILGKTQDDAIGEAFDKVAKMTGLPYPGGPSVAEKAKSGDPYAFNFPKARLTSGTGLSRKAQGGSENRKSDALQGASGAARSDNAAIYADAMSGNYNFSFSGLKTAVLRTAQGIVGHNHTLASTELPGLLSEAQKADIAASFQRVAMETVVDKTVAAFEEHSPTSVVIAGGVASSEELRRQLEEKLAVSVGRSQDLRLDAPQGAVEETERAIQGGTAREYRRPVTQLGAKNADGVVGLADKQVSVAHILRYTDRKLCTDNAAMIATLGCFKKLLKSPAADPYKLEINPSLKM